MTVSHLACLELWKSVFALFCFAAKELRIKIEGCINSVDESSLGGTVHAQTEAMTIHVEEVEDELRKHHNPPLGFFELFHSFLYESDKAVPRVYNIQTSTVSDVTNIVGIRSMNWSGRIYTPYNLQDKAPKEKSRAEEKEKEPEEEVDEFIKFIWQSEYFIIDQLNRTPTKITLLSLIMNSEPHHQALLKVLNEAYVAYNISQDKFKGIVSHITINNHLTFTDKEIPFEGATHNKPLNISVKCKDYLIVKVLMDNGSSLNVMPKCTLEQVIIRGVQMRRAT
ncbi:hypothetical protein Fmac_015171 [Flemingia macrophylla]|uniref:Uncharacterized protein n=1 Tax=Flemingia macrophylla TaxID=520843 RepID=A0ABD1MDT6_9FABA